MSNLNEVVVLQVLHPSNKMNPEQYVYLNEIEAKQKYEELLATAPDNCRIYIKKQPVIFTQPILNSTL